MASPAKRVRKGRAGDDKVVALKPPAARSSRPASGRSGPLDRAATATLARLTLGVSPHAVADAWLDWALHLARAPGRQAALSERALTNALKVLRFGAESLAGRDAEAPFAADAYDHRWRHKGWRGLPFSLLQQAFLAQHDWWEAATGDLRGLKRQTSQRTGFMVRQALDWFSPSNFPLLNPEILEATRKTGGHNFVDGLGHFCEDMMRAATQTHRSIPEEFALGERLACTPGEVVYRNELMELIQYRPQTKTVHPEPILIVPAWIMKYYILDLSPHNSLINWLVGQGYTVFAISWVNPSTEQAELSLEDYRKRGILEALKAIEAIVPGQRVHANGYCLGGTLLAIAAATMARDGDDRLASVTLMAAQVDFAEAGELLLFLDESQVAFLEDLMWSQGYLDRPQMAFAFAAIRSQDLIHTRNVQRYLLGQKDMPSDIRVWNGDTTRMPARMHSEYLRGIFLENRISAGRFAVEGQVIALKDIRVPIFVVATETDHIAPWRSVYKTQLFTDSDLHFVLTSGGHNVGILSHPGHPRRHYRLGHRPAGGRYRDPDTWLGQSATREGSWWPEYSRWLAAHSSKRKPSPSMGGSAQGYTPLCPAPGTYIFQT